MKIKKCLTHYISIGTKGKESYKCHWNEDLEILSFK